MLGENLPTPPIGKHSPALFPKTRKIPTLDLPHPKMNIMPKHPRRSFVRNLATLGVAGLAFPHLQAFPSPFFAPERKFRLCLNPGAIGVSTDQRGLLDMARKHGFEAMIAFPDELAKMEASAVEDLVAEMKDANITWGAAGLPVQFRESEEKFRSDLESLPRHAAAMERAGVTRTNTWIMPTHATLPYLDNFELHQERLQLVARVLDHHGVRLGLEYVGPKTLMARERFAFIRTMTEARQLINAIGETNVGFVLDSFHWFTAGETVADLLTVDPDEVVTVDLNDAFAGRSADEQIDNQRELPAATGVIDIAGFVGALKQIGYAGPARAEPFNAALNAMVDEEAVASTKEALLRAIGEA